MVVREGNAELDVQVPSFEWVFIDWHSFVNDTLDATCNKRTHLKKSRFSNNLLQCLSTSYVKGNTSWKRLNKCVKIENVKINKHIY